MTKRPLTQMAAASMMLAGLLVYSSKATAALTYNATTNAGWFATDAWNGPTTWTPGESAVINNPGAALVINLNSSSTISGLSVSGVQGTSINSTTAQALTFNGGTLHVASPQGFQTTGGVSIQGNLQLTATSGGFLRISSSATAAAYSGTATVTGGRFEWAAASNVGVNSHFVINGGTVANRDNVAATVGSITLNSGSFELGRNNSDASNPTVTLNSLSGTGGSIVTPPRGTNLPLSLLRTLTVNQSVNTTFEGAILGVNEGARIAFNKQGTGNLTLSGTINLARQTNITGGGLYINGVNASFTNEQAISGTAINVNGGTLGGTGTLTISGGDKVVLSSSGSLAAGEEDAIGRTTYNFTDGGELDLSAATAGVATGWLKFDLGSTITAGGTYDQITLTEGTLNIGTGLSFSDFAFSLQTGFAPGNYTLFSTVDGIFGSLGTTEGLLGGYESSLQVLGNNLVLTVVPEPTTVSLLLGSGALFLAARHRRRKSGNR